MKKLSLFALAAAGLLFGACSDKDVVQEIQKPVNYDFKDGGYIGISLSLPSADNTTRANDDLSNGTEDEFAVKNATLYIFRLDATNTGTEEEPVLVPTDNANPDEAAKFVAKVSLGNTYDPDTQGGIDPDVWGVQEDVDETNITSTYSKATLIPNEVASEMKADKTHLYYAYVIINHNGQIDAPTKDETTFKDFANQAFKEIGADIAAEKKVWETGLLMTNAPICSEPGGKAAPVDAKYSTLVKLDNQKIFGSKVEAEESPAACVYVERAAVKITVEDGRGEDAPEIEGYKVNIEGWQVINNEPSYYNTRHINDNGAAEDSFEDWGPYFNNDVLAKYTNQKYRFVSILQFLPTLPTDVVDDHTRAFRTYFAKDLQYNKNATLENTVASDDRPWIAAGKHAYTTENTFDVQHQTWRNTTMVTLKVSLSKTVDGTTTYPDFYTVGKGSQVMYATVKDAKAAIENIVKSDNDVASAMAALRKKISENNVDQEITSGLTVDFTAPEASKTDVPFTITLNFKKDGADYTTFNTTTDEEGVSEATLKADLEAAIEAVIKKDGKTTDEVLLSYYKGGVSYYNVKIQHFGDAETPWSSGGDYIAGGGADVNEIYFGAAQGATLTDAQIAAGQKNFLGRYGVVRDNWYKLSVDKISKIGTAEPVDPSTTTPDTPDDEIENFISVHVHIVPWVLREQSVQF